MNSQEVRQIVIDMLVAETGCDPNQLTDGEVHIATRKSERLSWPAHRRFNPHPGRIAAVTLGTGAVISVEPDDLAWAEDTFRCQGRDDLFRGELLAEISRRAEASGLTVHGPYPRFACARDQVQFVEPDSGYTVRITDIETELGADPDKIDRTAYPNALFPQPDESGRPTVLAAVAEQNGQIVGVVGVSKDSELMYQIGIDVLSEHRGNRLAPAMTTAAASAVFELGGVPYYGTSSSNIPSMRTALGAGLLPTWVEVLTRPA